MDVTQVVQPLVCGLPNQPARRPLLARHPPSDPLPGWCGVSRGLVKQPSHVVGELAHNRAKLAMVVSETHDAKVVEHRLQNRHVLDTRAVETSREDGEDVTHVTDVLESGPRVVARTCPEIIIGPSEHRLRHTLRNGSNMLQRRLDRHRRVCKAALAALVVLGGKRRQRAGHASSITGA